MTTGALSGEASARPEHKAGFWALTLGSIGVVFGDIGTSPLYAMRETLAHARGGLSEAAVFGVVSLIFWALVLVVTVKYLAVVMRADNRGEGGVLALMALAQRALGRRTLWITVLGVFGAALFYGDGLITPAISVLSAAEGLAAAPGVGSVLAPYVLPAAAAILIALFLVQSTGTAVVGRFFGPVTLVWFLALAALGVHWIVQEPRILQGLSPLWGLRLLFSDGLLGFAILGSVFLVVTGAEALYADIGHFGKGPIRLAWLSVALPCLTLNYFGQGALVLSDPSAHADPFFRMIPEAAYWPMLALATAATVIASQAVITGAFSMTRQAVQLGLLPRLEIRQTSEHVSGQIYAPQVNAFLMIGVILLLIAYQTSSNLAAAYGIAVTATMVVTMLQAFVVMLRQWRWPLLAAVAVTAPLLCLDIVFLGANSLKIAQGGWFPLFLGALLATLIWTWRAGSEALTAKTRRDSLPLADLVDSLETRPPHGIAGTGVFLTSDPDAAPVALMHNLKHNHVLHERNIILSVVTADAPHVPEDERIVLERLSPRFLRLRLTYGFMDEPNVPRALALARRHGLKLEIMSTSFFLGRRTVVPVRGGALPLWQERLFAYLMRNAANPTDFFRIPPGRVVEMGAQLTV